MAILKTAAIDEARIGYNPADDTLRGLLIEEQRTNSLLNNRNLGAANWIGLATVAQNETGIDGAANTAWTVTDNDAGVVQTINQDITVPDDSNRHTVSMVVKKTAATHYGGFRLYLLGGTTEVGIAAGDAFLRPSDGAKATTDTDIVLHEVHDAGDWWRLVAAIDNNSTGNTTLRIQIIPAANTDGTNNLDLAATGSLIVDFPQVELNAGFATSPIETAGAAVTRAADDVTSAIVGTPPDEFSFVFEGTTSPGSGIQALLELNDGTNDNGLRVNRALNESIRLTSKAGGVITINNKAYTGTFPDSSPIKIAIAIAAPGVRMSVNGGAVETFTGDVASSAFTQRSIGQQFNGAFRWNGWVKGLTEIPRALSDAELVQESML